uniref:Ig-like domain-containing protein n=1 Tax=Cyprinus carpio TaxID=7962 RepID=A0A8C1J4H4_CYPCA
MNDTERHERLSLGSDCSLNINNISTEDYGSYICQQWTGENGPKQRPDAHVYLHVLHVSQTEISAGLSVTLSCQLYSYAGVSCDDWIQSERIELFWVNQAGVKLTRSDSRYQISSSSGHCIITQNITLLNEDHNREWRCEVSHRDQVKTSVTYTVKSSAPGSTLIPVSSSNSETTSSRTTAAAPTKDKQIITSNSETTTAAHRPAVTPQKVIVIIVEFAVFAAPTVILLQIICARRAGRKDSQHPEEIEINTILE